MTRAGDMAWHITFYHRHVMPFSFHIFVNSSSSDSNSFVYIWCTVLYKVIRGAVEFYSPSYLIQFQWWRTTYGRQSCNDWTTTIGKVRASQYRRLMIQWSHLFTDERLMRCCKIAFLYVILVNFRGVLILMWLCCAMLRVKSQMWWRTSYVTENMIWFANG